ncbi:LANO_0F03972g1_1 [Lachancea nothofagi CBS 11611]|uniref:LANO_0F03972g1_1 n=1 Tax=Lachancea nothofagi CBS 11611 TaxID=1266666 RepID=A0A1G4K7D9_9SACH|nr:LANO_0F03972g1_1 [Lachancea nothofagi CBS 11611]
MPLHFSQLPSHRTYVLHWYRYTLRNVPKNVHSVHLQSRIKSITKITLFKHRHDKSSWSVYRLLRDMKTLNGLLLKSKTEKVWKLLTTYSQKTPRSRRKTSISTVTSEPPIQEPEVVRNAKILHDYILEKKRNYSLPNVVSDEYKSELLMPLALHEHFLAKLHRIEYKLALGPPKVSVNYTAAGKARIWFVRSALNRGVRQSKALGRLIRAEKRNGQKNLDYWDNCRSVSVWAWHEAAWEHLMETGTMLKGNPEQFLSTTNKNRGRDYGGTGPVDAKAIREWFDPINESLKRLNSQSIDKANYFEGYKHKSVLQSQRQYFTKKTEVMYLNRRRRYTRMLKEHLPYVTPFFKNQNLPDVMKSYKF